MGRFEPENKHSSVAIAKNRLKVLLVSDRVDCTPDKMEKLHMELYKTISKYIDVAADDFKVRITRSKITIKLTGDKL